MPVPTDSWMICSVGMASVFTSTRPPVNSPGRSGVKVLAMVTLSIRPEGSTSKAKLRLFGSVEGSVAPFNCTLLYRSPIPRILTYLPLSMVTPDTRPKTCATLLSEVFLIRSAEIPSDITVRAFCLAYNPFAEALLYVAVTTTSSSCSLASCNTTSSGVVLPAVIRMSEMLIFW